MKPALYTGGVKIYSWNIAYNNREFDRAFDRIAQLDFDVLCLQEVPEPFLARLRTLPYSIASATDIIRTQRTETFHNYCVILTPHRIITSGSINLPPPKRTYRTRALQYILWGLKGIQERGSAYATIEIPPLGAVRIFSLHLILSYPAQIEREFSIAMRERDRTYPNIVCGDFNILESPHIAPLNWLEGGRLQDIFAWRKTRREFEKRFAELGLQNPLRGARTQHIARSQLDHILVPNSWRVRSAHVLPDPLGSDHNPVFVEL